MAVDVEGQQTAMAARQPLEVANPFSDIPGEKIFRRNCEST